MNIQHPILASREDGFSWIRCEGKGSFQNSPTMKEWGEKEIESGCKILVIDLEQCTGMDSTFMGTMAGIAMRLMKISGGKLQVADPGEKNRQSLEDLGLDALMEIEPEDCEWRNQTAEIRDRVEPCGDLLGKLDKAPHVLEAHQQLCAADEQNAEKFATVLEFLEAEVKSKQIAGNK